jgi:hypothetical protein
MYISVNGSTYSVYVARLCAANDAIPIEGIAEVKVINPKGKEHWYEFDTAGLFDSKGKQYPAAEDLLAKWAVEKCVEESESTK